MKQAKIIDSDNICTIVTQKGMWEKKYQSVHTIKKMLLTKMILDTTWSEDLSHTTMREKNLWEHFFYKQIINYMYYCTLSTLKNNK
jgi:hypothetical protein